MEAVIEFRGVKFEVDFDFQPEEKMVRYYSDGTGHPGCEAHIEFINEFKHKGTCFLEWLEVGDNKEEVEELLMEQLTEY